MDEICHHGLTIDRVKTVEACKIECHKKKLQKGRKKSERPLAFTSVALRPVR